MVILLVDDNAACLVELERLLAERGYVVLCAADVDTALQLTERSLPDLVISDIRMPGRDGIELLQIMRLAHPAVPVVLLTGQTEAADTAAAFQFGASGFLQKPVRVDALLAGIERYRPAAGP